tara:strand:- start:63 stop:575 length:513 start_codon:yes stop_codon:yes gene_type:complete
MSLSQSLKSHLKRSVASAARYIKQNEESLETCKHKLTYLKKWNTTCPDGEEGRIKIDSVGLHLNVGDLESYIQGIIETIKMSKWEQKFYTYMYNKDKANALKYHNKISTQQLIENEIIVEDEESGNFKSIIEFEKNDGFDVVEGGEAHRRHSKYMKECYDDRVKMLSYLN